MKALLFVAALSLCACTTQKRTKANLAIDAEPTAAPAQTEQGEAIGATDESAPEGEIDLGLEGNSGPVTVEATTTGEEEAAEAEAPKADSKKKSSKKATKAAEPEEESEDPGEAELVLSGE